MAYKNGRVEVETIWAFNQKHESAAVSLLQI